MARCGFKQRRRPLQTAGQDIGGNPIKTIGLEETPFDQNIDFAQQERVLVTRDGKPVAVIVGVGGLDQEQLELAGSAKFWELIDQRRK
jgi:hypothetical protein